MAAPAPDSDLVRLTDLCVRCGLCLPHCPTYRIAREEGESPRGRIALAAALAADGALKADETLRRHLDQCLLCRACERVCPAEVPFARIMSRARERLGPRRDRPLPYRLILGLLARPRLWRLALALLHAGERLGSSRLLASLRLRPPLAILPRLPPRWRPRRASDGAAVYLFEGCATSRLASDACRAAEAILRRLGFRVLAAAKPHCCGAALRHEGLLQPAERLAKALHAAFPEPVPVLVLDSGCLEAVRNALGARAQDIHAFLLAEDLPRRVRWKEGQVEALLHHPCTLRAEPSARAAHDRLLASVPGLVLRALPERAHCCGAGGLQFLLASPTSLRLREELDGAPGMPLITANVGCRAWFTAGRLARCGAGRVYHPLESIAERIET